MATSSEFNGATIPLKRLIGLGILVRFFVSTTAQIFNVFLTIFAAGLQITPIAMGRLVSLFSFVGLATPFFGAMSDRLGFRTVLRLALLLAGIGLLLIAANMSLAIVALGMALTGIGVATFVPVFHAYLSAYLPYERRARPIAVLEYSWALAGIIGLFVAGQLIEAFSWRTPFIVLGIATLCGAVAFGWLPPSGHVARAASVPHVAWWVRGRNFFNLGPGARSAWAVIAAQMVSFFAFLHILIIHGGWLEQEYGLSAAQLGTVALILGFTDWGGSILVSLIGDRIGKRRGVLLGLIGQMLGFVAMPFLNINLPLAVLSLIIPRFCFEYAIVSGIPLLSEQVPTQRGKVLSLGAAGNLVGATLAGFTGPWAYLNFGVWGLGPVSAVITGIAVLILWRLVIERPNMVNASLV